MGHRVDAHIVLGEADWSRLAALPESLTWSVRRHEGFFGINVERTWRAVPDEPYGAMRLKDVPTELPEAFGELRAIQAFLAVDGGESAFPAAAFNLGLQLSQLLDAEILTVWTDDELFDFALISEAGAPTRLRLNAGDVEVTWTEERCVVVPLEYEGEEDGPPSIEVGALRERIPRLQLEAVLTVEPLLHRVAAKEARAFVGSETPPLGLGSFDGDPDLARVVARR